MTKITETNASRIAGAVPNTESSLDNAMLALSSLIGTLIQARQETGVPAATGQASIIRLTKAQSSLVAISNDVLRVHGELLDIQKEVGVGDLHECPQWASAESDKRHLRSVA